MACSTFKLLAITLFCALMLRNLQDGSVYVQNFVVKEKTQMTVGSNRIQLPTRLDDKDIDKMAEVTMTDPPTPSPTAGLPVTLVPTASPLTTASPTINQPPPISNNHIRQWGCNNIEAPLIYVHIGKAGGGMVRARFAAAALDFNRTSWRSGYADDHYYPTRRQSSENYKPARFANSIIANYRQPFTGFEESFEGTFDCHATTPLGMRVACGLWQSKFSAEELQYCQHNMTECGIVYMGHNYLGSEMHVLPRRFLEAWWVNATGDSSLLGQFQRMDPLQKTWCKDKGPANTKGEHVRQTRDTCGPNVATEVDQAFVETIAANPIQTVPQATSTHNYGPVWASLPVQRVTLVREPFSWAVSKFFWQKRHEAGLTCGDIKAACQTTKHVNDTTKHWTYGWMHHDAFYYIFYFCGEDCALRYEKGQMTLEEIEAQAEYNLRNSFSVVGLLHEQQTFFDMVTARVDYLDMDLNPEVTGDSHSTGTLGESCKALYKSENFRKQFKAACPALAALDRLYHVAIEVNQAQQVELRQCSERFRVKHPSR